MWLTVAVAAIGAGLQIFSQVRQNNALKNAGADAVNEAETDRSLNVLKADAAYLGALSQSTETTAQVAQEKAKLEASQQRLRTAGIIAAVVLVIIVIVVAVVKNRKS